MTDGWYKAELNFAGVGANAGHWDTSSVGGANAGYKDFGKVEFYEGSSSFQVRNFRIENWVEEEIPTTYKVTFDGENERLVGEGGKVSAPQEPTRIGYTFDGWYNGNVKWNFEDVVESNLDLTSKWTAIIYNITYNLNGGTGATNGTYTIESADIILPTPTKANYDFAGWYENSDFTGEAVTKIEAGSTGDKEFYAKWTEIEYTITYNLNGGELPESAILSYTATTPTFDLPTPTKTLPPSAFSIAKSPSGRGIAAISASARAEIKDFAPWALSVRIRIR